MEQDLEVFQEQIVAKASPCEADLQGLVHQIDIMVNTKKVEWERKMKALEAKMDIQDQELASAQSKLDQKSQEVRLLQQKLKDLQKTNYEMTQNYETQLQALQSQFAKLTGSYGKLQARYLRQKKGESRQKCEKSLEPPSELSNLHQKVEKQTQNYQSQICHKKRNQQEVITQPEGEKDELIIAKIKATVKEIAKNKNKLEEEKLKLQEDLKMYQTQCQNMEAGCSEMRSERRSADASWRRRQLQWQHLHTQLLGLREHEQRQQTQIKHQASYVQLTEQLQNKNTALSLLAQSQEHQQGDLNKIRNHVYPEEQQRMKTEISALTEELHQKEITIATIMEKASLLERQLKMELEIKDKLLAKQQLLDCQCKAKESAKTHPKEMVENQECQSCMGIDLSKKGGGKCPISIHKLQQENVRLQNGLVKLQNDTETSILGQEAEHSYQTHSEMKTKTERTFPKQDACEMESQQTAVLPARGYHRNCAPALCGQGNITGSKSDGTLSSHTLDRGDEKREDDKPPSPPLSYPLGFGGLFPEEGRRGSFLSPALSAEEITFSSSPEMSLMATTEKFLQEEEKHTREFEARLNSHLEELQRHAENTLQKYARMQQSKHT